MLLLLKSSDRISHDLEELSRVAEAIENGDEDPRSSPAELLQNISTPTLVLRKWHSLRPGAEFRAFLEKDCVLVALCQRDITQHFEGLSRDRRSILKSVARFVRKELAPALRVAQPASSDSSAAPPSSVLASSRLVADLYVHANNGKVRLVDLAAPGGTTSPLLFSAWEEVYPERRGERENGSGEQQQEEKEGDIEKGDDASEAELSLPSSSDDDEGEESEDDEQQQTSFPPYEPALRVHFRVVSGASSRGRIAPGRSLYGAPHDFADGECIEALVERLRTTTNEGG